MRKFLTIVSLALLLVAFGAASWGQAGHSKAHRLRVRVVKLEHQVKQLEFRVSALESANLQGCPVSDQPTDQPPAPISDQC